MTPIDFAVHSEKLGTLKGQERGEMINMGVVRSLNLKEFSLDGF